MSFNHCFVSKPVSPVLAAAIVTTLGMIPAVGLAIDIPTIELDSGIKIVATQRAVPSFQAYPIIPSVPINGFEPKIIFTLTDAEDPDDFVWTANRSTTVEGNFISGTASPHYAVATLDSGGQTHLVAYNELGSPGFDFFNSGKDGGYTAQLGGASGSEFADVSDPIAIYTTGFANVTTGGSPTVNSATLQGQTNVSVLTSQEGSALPSLVGLPIFAQYGVSIKNSETITRTVNGKSYKTPNITLTDHNPTTGTGPIAGLNHRAALDLADPFNSSTSQPAFIPSFDDFQNLHENPQTPSFWSFPFIETSYSHTDGSRLSDFLFDTGAQVTVLSEQRAVDVGFDVSTDTPDFTVEVAGVGGTTTQVPGFYLQSLTLSASGGSLVLSNVPVLVLNVVDPHDGVGFVDGIVGMNLFHNRDLFVNLSPADPYVRWSDAYDAKWKVNASGNWSGDTNWMLGVPNAVDDVANFTDAISAPRNVTVDIPVKVGSMTFNNASKYTISGSQTITVESSLTGAITVASGSHEINAPVAIHSDTLFTITNAADKLKLTQLATSTKNLTKTGSGKLEVNAVRASGLNINAGTIEITTNGTASGVSVVDSLSITGAGSRLELHDNDIIVEYAGGSSPYADIINKIKTGLTLMGGNGAGIGSTEVDTQSLPGTMLGVVDNGAIGGQITSVSGFTGFAGDSVIVKYTWFGDSNLDGVVDGSDYALIDSGFTSNGTLTGWVFGDYDYSGQIDGSDFALIDTGLTSQSASLPEPAMMSLLGFGTLSLIRRRRKS